MYAKASVSMKYIVCTRNYEPSFFIDYLITPDFSEFLINNCLTSLIRRATSAFQFSFKSY
jgi:hypothetical protein